MSSPSAIPVKQPLSPSRLIGLLQQAKSDIGFSVGVVKAMFPNTLAYSSALERIYFEIKEVQDRLSKEFIQKE